VRLENPVALAQYVLRDQPEWTRDRIEQAMHAGEEKTVKLESPLPVYLGYWTARVHPDNSVQFRGDVYNVDRRQAARLADRLDRLRRTGAAAATATTAAAVEQVKGKPSPLGGRKPAATPGR
jgi:murein L,D-transpeptidase YcbB/YkuD